MENGVKIIQLEGSDVLKNNIDGQQINREYKAVFPNSLLLNQLKNIGLNVSKNDTTREIISLQFSYGYTPMEARDTTVVEELQVENKSMTIKINELKLAKKSISKREEKKPLTDEINRLQDLIKSNKSQIKNIKSDNKNAIMSKEQIRDYLYANGFKLDFYKKDKSSNEYVIDETIEYQFWFRTPSKSRVGDVMFISTRLAEEIKDWQRMGLQLPQGEAKIVEMGAYESLTSSSIEGTITINPDNILVIDDIDSFFELKCAKVYVDEKGECKVKRGLSKVKNTLHDGQALLDESLFTGSNSMMLLRQHFFKANAFRTHIQKFMMDWCEANGKDYNTHTVTDRYGNSMLVKDILMITTENAMKWEKFINIGASYDYWKQKVNESGNEFGICKVDHSSKYGSKQRMSYQMINTLDIDQAQMDILSQDTIDYVDKIKNDEPAYINFLKLHANDVNINNMLIDLYNHNHNFANSCFFREFKKKDISKYVTSVRGGKLLSEGDNLTMVGNPYTMLLHAVGDVPVTNGVLDKGYVDITLPICSGDDQHISVYTKRFDDGEYLAAFRNPHNSPNNIGYHKNYRHELMEKYFNFSNNIMAVNCIQTEEQELKNSEDFDSDFNFVTNNTVTVESAKRVFRNFPCIVNEIPQSNKSYDNTMENYSLIDNNLAKAKYDIGLSSNLAQLAMSWFWNDRTEELADIVAIMSVLAQCAIDNSKRLYAVDIAKEIDRIRKLDCMNKHKAISSKGNEIKGKPYFWKYVSSKVNEDSLIQTNCPMNYLQVSLNRIKTQDHNTQIANSKFIKKIEGKANDKQMSRIEEKIRLYDETVRQHNVKVTNNETEKDEEKWLDELLILENNVISYVAGLKLKQKTMQMLIVKALSNNKESKKYKRKLLNALYKSNTELFLSVFKSENENSNSEFEN